MRFKLRSIFAALVAVLALGAVASASASAHNFRVEGKALTGEEAATGTGGEYLLTWGVGGGVSLEAVCNTSSFAENLLAEGKLKLGKVTFKECKMRELECIMPEALESVQTGQLATVKEALGIEFKGAQTGGQKEEFLRFDLTGAKCPVVNEYIFTGHWGCELHEAGTEAVEHEVVCKKADSHIAFDGNAGTVKYSEKIKLVSGKKWSAV